MISEQIKRFKAELPEGVNLVAVSKFHPIELLKEAYSAGQRIFGESRVQELLPKIEEMPKDVKWHFIGHLQSNKVKALVGKVSLIESVDSVKLLELIDKESQNKGVETNVLMQVHVAKEETKFGFYPEELLKFFGDKRYASLTNVRICGVMGMASNTDDEERVRADFRDIYKVFQKIKENFGAELKHFNSVSMGMSGDYQIAIEEGSNYVRIGTAIFGEREY